MQRSCYLPEALRAAVCEDGCLAETCSSVNKHLIKLMTSRFSCLTVRVYTVAIWYKKSLNLCPGLSGLKFYCHIDYTD